MSKPESETQMDVLMTALFSEWGNLPFPVAIELHFEKKHENMESALWACYDRQDQW